MIRPNAHVDNPHRKLDLVELDGTEDLEKLIAEWQAKLSPCPCCGRKNPNIEYTYNGFTGRDDKHEFYVECPGDPMHTWHDNPKADGCGNRSGMLMAKEDEDYTDFKEALRYITEAWNRRH